MTEQEQQNKLKELLTEDFITKLIEVAKLYGWSGDAIEIAGFVEGLYYHANGKPLETDLEPYEIEYKQP